jgi:lysozyme
VRAAGYRFVILKATEGSSYVDPMFAANRARARAAGMVVGAYHFARAGRRRRGAKFCATVGSLSPGELAVLDWEVAAPDPVGWSLVWLRGPGPAGREAAHLHEPDGPRRARLVAGGGRDDFGLWLAKYDFVQTQPTGGRWPTVAMKQFTDRGTVPGIAGGVDVDVFYGDEAALARYGAGGQRPTPAPEPLPIPPVEDDDMRLNAYRVKGTAEVRAGGPGIWWHVPSTAVLQSMQAHGTLGPTQDVSQDEFDATRAAWLDVDLSVRNAVWNTPFDDGGAIGSDKGQPWASTRLGQLTAKVDELLARLPKPPAA